MLQTRQTHPKHETIGQFFTGPSFGQGQQVYYCDSYDPANGFWMTNIREITDRHNVSERAVGRTFHRIDSDATAKRGRLGITGTTADEIERQLAAARLLILAPAERPC